jgi:hypothetical protein
MTPNVMAYFVQERSQVQTRRLAIQIEVVRDSSQPLQGFKSGRDHFPPQSLSHLYSLQSCQVHSQEHLTAVPWRPLSFVLVKGPSVSSPEGNNTGTTQTNSKYERLSIHLRRHTSPKKINQLYPRIRQTSILLCRASVVKCVYGEHRQAYTSTVPALEGGERLASSLSPFIPTVPTACWVGPKEIRSPQIRNKIIYMNLHATRAVRCGGVWTALPTFRKMWLETKYNSFTRCLFPVLFNDSVLTVMVTHKAKKEQAHY